MNLSEQARNELLKMERDNIEEVFLQGMQKMTKSLKSK